jgi:hypothetical protein
MDAVISLLISISTGQGRSDLHTYRLNGRGDISGKASVEEVPVIFGRANKAFGMVNSNGDRTKVVHVGIERKDTSTELYSVGMDGKRL